MTVSTAKLTLFLVVVFTATAQAQPVYNLLQHIWGEQTAVYSYGVCAGLFEAWLAGFGQNSCLAHFGYGGGAPCSSGAKKRNSTIAAQKRETAAGSLNLAQQSSFTPPTASETWSTVGGASTQKFCPVTNEETPDPSAWKAFSFNSGSTKRRKRSDETQEDDGWLAQAILDASFGSFVFHERLHFSGSLHVPTGEDFANCGSGDEDCFQNLASDTVAAFVRGVAGIPLELPASAVILYPQGSAFPYTPVRNPRAAEGEFRLYSGESVPIPDGLTVYPVSEDFLDQLTTAYVTVPNDPRLRDLVVTVRKLVGPSSPVLFSEGMTVVEFLGMLAGIRGFEGGDPIPIAPISANGPCSGISLADEEAQLKYGNGLDLAIDFLHTFEEGMSVYQHRNELFGLVDEVIPNDFYLAARIGGIEPRR